MSPRTDWIKRARTESVRLTLILLCTLASCGGAGSASSAPNPLSTVGAGPTSSPGTLCSTFAQYGRLDYCYLMNESSGVVLHDSSRAGNNGVIYPFLVTSGTLTSYPNYQFTYGYFEARTQNPPGQGFWPAFWLIAENGNPYEEIDAMEEFATPSDPNPTAIWQTVHFPSGGCSNCTHEVTVGTPNTVYHRYGVEWKAHAVTFYVDGVKENTVNVSMPDAMYLILSVGVLTQSYENNPLYVPTAAVPATFHASGVRAYNPNRSCTSASPAPLPTPIGTITLPSGDICVDGTEYVPETPPTDSFTESQLNQYNLLTNPTGTWQTQYPYGSRGSGGGAFSVDNTSGGFNIWPFATGSTGLTISLAAAPQEITGYGSPALTTETTASLGTLGAAHGIFSTNDGYLKAGYAPTSGSFSLACYVSVPQPATSASLIGTNNPQSDSPLDKGFYIWDDSTHDLSVQMGYGNGYASAKLASAINYSTPEAIILTYNNSTRVATIYAGNSSSPRSESITLPATYAASGNDMYFNAGMYDNYSGGDFGPCAEWGGTVLTSAAVDTIAGLTK